MTYATSDAVVIIKHSHDSAHIEAVYGPLTPALAEWLLAMVNDGVWQYTAMRLSPPPSPIPAEIP